MDYWTSFQAEALDKDSVCSILIAGVINDDRRWLSIRYGCPLIGNTMDHAMRTPVFS